MSAHAVIINADDLGLWPSVDQGIFHAWSQHAIGDSTAFANASELPEILQTAADRALPVGIHLNLTHGRPLSDPADIPALVTTEGLFTRPRQPAPRWPIDQVRPELRLQVERVLTLGWVPSHLDSHHHIHCYPEVLEVVIELAHTLQIPVRATDEEMRSTLRAAGIATPDAFSMAFYGEGATVETLMRLVEECPGGVLEIMTHPGKRDPEIPGSYREERSRELTALTDPCWHAYLADRQLPIVGFGVLT